jgi:uncharacterized protein (TIGR04255 family)
VCVRTPHQGQPPVNDVTTPLAGPPPTEVPLKKPPLIRVVVQVRFPLVASVESQEFIAPFQESIRKLYPVLRPEQNRGFVVQPEGGVVETRLTKSWRFHDVEGLWHVVLAPGFVALETVKYSSRDDFLARFRRVMQALKKHVDPTVVDRVGVRYVDRVVGENLSDLPQLIRPEVTGILGTSLRGQTQHAICQSVLALPDGSGQVSARWGLVPAQGTVDPAVVDAIDQPSWILDLDAFKTETRLLEVEAIVDQARGFAERLYSIFRWAVTAEFLRRYGGEP